MKMILRILAVGFVLIGSSLIWWLAPWHKTFPAPVSVSSAVANAASASPVPAQGDPEGALHLLASTPVGQITGRDAKQLADILARGDSAARSALHRAISSADDLERLLAFRLLLESEGWSPRLREIALNDPFVLLRSEATGWLYLKHDFAEWDAFLAAAAGRSAADYEALKRTLTQSTLWGDLPAGLEMLGIGRGIDRYLQEYLKRNDAAAAASQRDLLSGTLAPGAQETLLQALHAANRPDYQDFLRLLLARTDSDNSARFEAIWFLGQEFASATTRDLLTAHLSSNPNDPLRSRVGQALNSVNEQLAIGANRLDVMEARLSLALQSGDEAGRGAILVAVLDEGLRSPSSVDTDLIRQAGEVVALRAHDYQASRRMADIEFLRWKKR